MFSDTDSLRLILFPDEIFFLPMLNLHLAHSLVLFLWDFSYSKVISSIIRWNIVRILRDEIFLQTVCRDSESLFNVNVWLSGFIKDQELRCYNKIKSSASVVSETINRMTRKLFITKKVVSVLTDLQPSLMVNLNNSKQRKTNI